MSRGCDDEFDDQRTHASTRGRKHKSQDKYALTIFLSNEVRFDSWLKSLGSLWLGSLPGCARLFILS